MPAQSRWLLPPLALLDYPWGDIGIFQVNQLPSGSQMADRCWKLTGPGGAPCFVLKERFDSPVARSQATLAHRVTSEGHLGGALWLPHPAPFCTPYQICEGFLYQGWTWLAGESFSGDCFPQDSAHTLLQQFHGALETQIGLQNGALPCVFSRIEVLRGPINFSTCLAANSLEAKALKVVEALTPKALKYLGKLPSHGNMVVCHGDPWAGNWIELGSYPGTLGLIDLTHCRFDHPASDHARLLGSTLSFRDNQESDDSMVAILAWTGHVAALKRWCLRLLTQKQWLPTEVCRVQWLLLQMGTYGI